MRSPLRLSLMLLTAATASELFLITLPSNQTTTMRRPVLPHDWNDDKVFKLSDLTPAAPTSKTKKTRKSPATTVAVPTKKMKKQKKRKKQQNNCFLFNIEIIFFLLLLL